MKQHLPNALTCGNLLCGCLGIVQVFNGHLETASWLIGLAAIFDFFDGFLARLLHVSSAIGKELDSLADMVTFGVLPALMMLNLIENSCTSGTCTVGLFGFYKPYIALALAISSALRLAKFNIDTRQSDSFIGVPTPANGLLIASLPLILQYQPAYTPYVLNFQVLLIYCVIMAYLMLAELPLFALKFKNFAWKGNEIKFIFVGISLVLMIFLKFAAIPLVILLYVGLSVLNNFLVSKK